MREFILPVPSCGSSEGSNMDEAREDSTSSGMRGDAEKLSGLDACIRSGSAAPGGETDTCRW